MANREVEEPPDRRQVRHFLNGDSMIETRPPNPLTERVHERESVQELLLKVCEACKIDVEFVKVNALAIAAFPEALERISKMKKAVEVLKALYFNADLRVAFLEDPQHFVNVLEEYGWENVREVVNHNSSN